MMDMYYHLKEALSCQNCRFPMAYSHDVGYMSFVAVCIACGKEYEIDLEIRNKE